MTASADLAAFLLARIAEDEAVAGAEAIAQASSGTVVLGPAYDDHPDAESVRETIQDAIVGLRRTDPWRSPWTAARVLAECDAKRQIVEWAEELGAGLVNDSGWVLQMLALPYAGHPEYREEWKP